MVSLLVYAKCMNAHTLLQHESTSLRRKDVMLHYNIVSSKYPNCIIQNQLFLLSLPSIQFKQWDR